MGKCRRPGAALRLQCGRKFLLQFRQLVDLGSHLRPLTLNRPVVGLAKDRDLALLDRGCSAVFRLGQEIRSIQRPACCERQREPDRDLSTRRRF